LPCVLRADITKVNAPCVVSIRLVYHIPGPYLLRGVIMQPTALFEGVDLMVWPHRHRV
jgi:hypothetical protein